MGKMFGDAAKADPDTVKVGHTWNLFGIGNVKDPGQVVAEA